MDAYHQLGMQRNPFDQHGAFYTAPAHAETLATLRFAIRSQKRCVVVVGDSGTGKTTVAKQALGVAAEQAAVCWLQGYGQGKQETVVHAFPLGAFATNSGASYGCDTTLRLWTRLWRRTRTPAVVVVDNADALPEHSWNDLLAALLDDGLPQPGITVMLVGLPRLLQRLAEPQFVQLRRRIFRTQYLEPLTPAHARAYLAQRVASAGADADALFSIQAQTMLVRLAHGNPGMLNQLAENALLEAFGDDRKAVTVADVGNATRALAGGQVSEFNALPATPHTAALPTPEVPDSVENLEQRLLKAVHAVRAARGAKDGAAAATPTRIRSSARPTPQRPTTSPSEATRPRQPDSARRAPRTQTLAEV